MRDDNATQEQLHREYFSFSSDDYNAGFRVRLMIDDGVRGHHALASLNRALDKPFGEVPIPVRALAFALSQHGHPVEYSDRGVWKSAESPSWCAGLRYRILPKPHALVLPSIDWSHVAPKWKWLAQDPCGDGYLTTARPRAHGEEWMDGCDYAEAHGFASFAPGNGDWTKLIVQRPEGV